MILLFVVLLAVIAAGTAAAGAVAARRVPGTDDPVALKARAWQYLAAGPLTAASAALMLPLLRASPAVHTAARCPAKNVFLCTSAPAVWMFFLVAGPVFGLAIGACAGAIPATELPSQPAAPTAA